MTMKILVQMMMTGLLACMTATVAAQEPAAAGQEFPVDIMQMSRDSRTGQIMVTALVNGVPMRMMLDTGATHTVLHEESAARLPQAEWIDTSKMQFRGNSSQHPRLLKASLVAGPGVSTGHPLMVMNLSAVRSMLAGPLDGIIGMDFLASLPFTFDFRKGEWYWGMPDNLNLLPVPGEMEPSGRIHWVVSCQGKELKLLLDTGSMVTRVCQEDWLPGTAGEIQAQIGNVDTAAHQQMVEGKPGDLVLAPGAVLKGVTPLLCPRGEFTLLGLDALRDAMLVHIPSERLPGGLFLVAPTEPEPQGS